MKVYLCHWNEKLPLFELFFPFKIPQMLEMVDFGSTWNIEIDGMFQMLDWNVLYGFRIPIQLK